MKKKVAIVVGSPMMVNFFLISQINHLSHHFNITLITGESDKQVALNKKIISKSINIITVKMERKVSILSDISAFFALIRVFYEHKFDIVHSVSPKSGLLAQLAAFFLGVSIRVHTFTGQVWASKKGLWRYLLKFIDSLIVAVSTNILVDSYSQRSFLMSEGILNHDNSRVLLNGSISGINEKRFTASLESYRFFRKDNNLQDDVKIILFIGRLTKDKGIVELLESFKSIAKNAKDWHLLLVGPDEDHIVKNYVNTNDYKSRIMYFNYTNKPEYYMQASDILCLPSLREGFGNVVLEAAMCGVPSVVSEIYGLKDVVEKDITANTFVPSSADGLYSALSIMVTDKEKLLKMGEAAHNRAKYLFSSRSINNELKIYYKRLLRIDV